MAVWLCGLLLGLLDFVSIDDLRRHLEFFSFFRFFVFAFLFVSAACGGVAVRVAVGVVGFCCSLLVDALSQ